MNGIEFDQIITFLATVDHRGFTAAGKALGRDGSILSRRVTALERRLGVRLLERTTRRLGLTEAGEALPPYECHHVNDDRDQAGGD